jgi:hypothetical protein
MFAALYQVYLSCLFGIPIWLLLRMLANILIGKWAGITIFLFAKNNGHNDKIMTDTPP